VPGIRHRLRDFHGYLGAIVDLLVRGRNLRGHRARLVRAAIGHAVAFPTWRSLTREQSLGNEDAVDLMCSLVEDAVSGRPRRSRV
jgi:hypothetical protein